MPSFFMRRTTAKCKLRSSFTFTNSLNRVVILKMILDLPGARIKSTAIGAVERSLCYLMLSNMLHQLFHTFAPKPTLVIQTDQGTMPVSFNCCRHRSAMRNHVNVQERLLPKPREAFAALLQAGFWSGHKRFHSPVLAFNGKLLLGRRVVSPTNTSSGVVQVPNRYYHSYPFTSLDDWL